MECSSSDLPCVVPDGLDRSVGLYSNGLSLKRTQKLCISGRSPKRRTSMVVPSAMSRMLPRIAAWSDCDTAKTTCLHLVWLQPGRYIDWPRGMDISNITRSSELRSGICLGKVALYYTRSTESLVIHPTAYTLAICSVVVWKPFGFPVLSLFVACPNQRCVRYINCISVS